MVTWDKTSLLCAEFRDWITLKRNCPNEVTEYSKWNIFVN